jgi:hypothetical protein
MGREARCTARFGRKASEGTALLESKELIFQGDFRLAIPYEEIQRVATSNGTLQVTWPEGTASFELGAKEAALWADRIGNPKSLIDKLGVKASHVVSITGIDDEEFLAKVRARAANVAIGRLTKDSDMVFAGMTRMEDLKKLPTLERSIARNGAIWAVWPKGRSAFTENHIRAAAIRTGLTDVKVAAFSDTHSALKLVIPVARR